MPTCTASTWCCPTSRSCATTRRGSPACVATHGHEDHVGGIQFLLRDNDGIGHLLDRPLPIYGGALTLGLARNRIEEAGLLGRTQMVAGHRRPGRRRSARSRSSSSRSPTRCRTPTRSSCTPRKASILHSGDFKLDLTPVDGRRTDLARLGQLGASGRARPARRLDERRGAGLRAERDERRWSAAVAVRRAPRPADHHRQLRQPPAPHPADRRRGDRRSGRKVATLGLSMKKNVRLGRELGVLTAPRVGADRHRGHRQLPARSGLRDLHRIAG